MRALIIGVILGLFLFCLPVVAIGAVDIEVVSFEAPPVALPGEAIGSEILLRIRNNGSDNITTVFTVGFYISTDETITLADQLLIGGRQSVGFIGAGMEVNVPLYSGARIPESYPTGPAFLGVVVDEFNYVAEDDETNNTASSPVDVEGIVPVQVRSWGAIKQLYNVQ